MNASVEIVQKDGSDEIFAANAEVRLKTITVIDMKTFKEYLQETSILQGPSLEQRKCLMTLIIQM